MIEATTSDMAEAIGVSPRRLQQMVGEGLAVRVGPGLYDFEETSRRYIGALKAKAERQGAQLDLRQERARLAKETADCVALKNEALRKTLVRADEAEVTWRSIKTRVRERLLRIPDDLLGQRPNFTPATMAVLRQEIETALVGLEE